MRKGALAGVLVALLAGLLVVAMPGVGFAAGDDGRELTAKLTGEAEVPGPGDPDGTGRANVTLGDREVCFAIEWKGVEAPHMAHVHRGPEGVAGPIVIPLFVRELPLSAGISMVGGCVNAPAGLLEEIDAHPGEFYVNVHNPKFPAGAIRGQLQDGRADLGGVDGLDATLRGINEVPGPGDADGRGTAAVAAAKDRVCWSVSWDDIGDPTRAHIHQGKEGVSGPIVVPFFENVDEPLPDTLAMVGGCTGGVDPALVSAINDHPEGFYVNVHNTGFPAGAIRGQLRH